MHRIKKAAGALALVATIGVAGLACTPQQIELYGAYVRAYKAEVVSPGTLAAIRNCESGGNYRAVSSSGTYRGAYQFSQSTWNGVAQRHHALLVGKDPITTHPAQQDMMARALYSESRGAPWPNCG